MPIVAALCVAAAVRVFLFAAAFPFFNNVDEQAHVDLVLKYARGHWPSEPLERFDPAAARLFVRYGAHDYLDRPERFPGGVVPSPPTRLREDHPGLVGARAAWEASGNHEANSPPVYYAVAGLWAAAGQRFGLSDGRLLYWIRFLDVPLVALLVAFAHGFCRASWPGRLDLQVGVPLLVAFLPQDVYYTVNSDVLSPLLFGLSLGLLLDWSRRDTTRPAHDALVGLSVALTFLVKYTNVALVVVFGALALRRIRRLHDAGRGRAALAAVSVASLAAALPVALWLARNQLLLGDALGTRAKVEALRWSHLPLADLAAHPLFSLDGFWTFWSGLLATLWRGEIYWHAHPLALPAMDAFYAISSLVLLLAAAAGGRWLDRGAERTPTLAAWGAVVFSIATLAWLSVSFDYGDSFYPSREAPYFTSGRLVSGALIPFLVLYLNGARALFAPFSRTAATLAFAVTVAVLATTSEVALTWPIFGHQGNWFHLP